MTVEIIKGDDAQAMLSKVLGTGKSMVRTVGAEKIAHFIENQPGISGKVVVSNLRGTGDVGASSGIVIFNASYDNGTQHVVRDLVLRHAPSSEGRLFYEYDMSRQFKVQCALYGGKVPVAEPLWLDATGEFLEVDGFIMGFTPGKAPHTAAFSHGPLADMSAPDRERALGELMTSLVAVHQTDLQAANLTDFVMNAAGKTPLERCINWFWQTWEWIENPAFSRMVPVYRWLLDNAPDLPPELVHGDATLHNYMFNDSRLVGIVDWEMSTLNRAEADLALQCVTNSLFAPPADSGQLRPPSDAEWLDLYQKAGGRAVENFDYYKRFSAFMVTIGVVSLQRNMPAEVRDAQKSLIESIWAIAEN